MKTIHTRQDFLKTDEAQAYADTVSNPVFITGLRAALLEFLVSNTQGTTWEAAARSHDYQQGAKDFAQYLLTFLDAEPAKPQTATENLKWPTKQSLAQRPPKQNP